MSHYACSNTNVLMVASAPDAHIIEPVLTNKSVHGRGAQSCIQSTNYKNDCSDDLMTLQWASSA